MRERKRNEKGEEMMIGPHGISHAPLRELESARYAWGLRSCSANRLKYSWPGGMGPFSPSRESSL